MGESLKLSFEAPDGLLASIEASAFRDGEERGKINSAAARRVVAQFVGSAVSPWWPHRHLHQVGIHSERGRLDRGHEIGGRDGNLL